MFAKILILTLSLYVTTISARTQSFAILSDAGQFNENIDYLKDSLLKFGEKRLIMAGDHVYEHGKPHQEIWGSWHNDFDFYAVALGNHHQGYDKLESFFGLPGEYYAVASEGHRFIVLNSDNKQNVEEQTRFLEMELESADEPFVFVLYHHPFASISSLHHWKERENFHRQTLPILQKYKDKIFAMFFGHDHIASAMTIDGIPVFLAASTFQSRQSTYHDYLDQDRGIHVKTHWNYLTGRYWLRMQLEFELERARFDYIRVGKDEIDCTIFLKQDKKMDVQKNCWQ